MTALWGAIGIGAFSSNVILPSMATVVNLYAIASHDRERAARIAAATGAVKIYSDYCDLLADSDVTHVYVGVPTSKHREWAARAVTAGKTVLCEKPFALTSSDDDATVEVAISEADRLFVGWMYRHHVRWRETRKLISRGDIGEPYSLTFHYSYRDTHSNPRRWKREFGGGALALVGSYGVHMAQWLLGPMPASVHLSQVETSGGVDAASAAILSYPGAVAGIVSDLRSPDHQFACIAGSEGSIFIDTPINPSPAQETSITIRSESAQKVERFPPCDQFAEQALWASAADAPQKYAERELDLQHNPLLLERLMRSGAVQW